MSRVAIVTDSTASLPAEVAAARGIHVVPLQVVVGAKVLDEGPDGATPDVVAQALRDFVPVSTSRPAPTLIADLYRRLASEGAEEIVSVHLSGRISGTVESARSAASELTGELRVDVVDSGVLGMALGYAACTGARAAADGGGMEEVVRAVEARAAGTRTWFYVDTLEHLRRGGRIGRAQALLGSALAIKPLLTVRDGEVAAQEKVRTRAKALSRLVEHAAEAVVDAGGPASGVEVAVHELAAREAAEELASTLAGRTGVEPEIVELDPVVGSHTGPGTLAVVVAPR